MPIFALDRELVFPPPHLAEPDGLLAIGGDLSSERVLLAYRNGIFPWYEGEHILWWSPDPRFVLFPEELKTNRETAQAIEEKSYVFSINKAFDEVIHHCKEIHRPGQDGTWITEEVEKAYKRLHQEGWAHSAELWDKDELIGGLYGIRIGQVFFGESMFSKKSKASRIAFTQYVQHLQSENVKLIDCQVYTSYLESLGARSIPGTEFQKYLKEFIK